MTTTSLKSPGTATQDVPAPAGDYYITTALPYVNAAPHLGHALELVQADTLARHRRLRGQSVRFLTGTDDNALKNVTAAATAGVSVADFVAANADAFAQLRRTLSLSVDDFISTSSDPRHLRGVELLWRRSERAGDFYRKSYTGLYCPGCEGFFTESDLTDGLCGEHRRPLEPVSETNWFFRLSRYGEAIEQAITSGRLRIEPAVRANEVLGFLRSGVDDISVSRPATRSGGWGIPVPGDDSQVVYVWWDALANYVTALLDTSGASLDESAGLRRWWTDSAERVHVLGKGITRFHAVYWIGLLLSARLQLPTRILVHDYLTVDGLKVSKSAGNSVDIPGLVAHAGTDAVRWWLLSGVNRVGDTAFTTARLRERYNEDLANGIGNLTSRVAGLLVKFRARSIPSPEEHPTRRADPPSLVAGLSERIDAALARFDFRAATAALTDTVEAANRLIETERPWQLYRAESAGDTEAGRRLDSLLSQLVPTCRAVALELGPFVPDGADRLAAVLAGTSVSPTVSPVFARLQP